MSPFLLVPFTTLSLIDDQRGLGSNTSHTGAATDSHTYLRRPMPMFGSALT